MSEYSQKVANHVRENPIILKHFIFHMATKERMGKPTKPIFQVYKSMCEQYGDDVMDYLDFEYMYYKFYQGEFDMNIDRSSEPQTRTFSDFPLEIFDKIVKNLSFLERLLIRNVSKSCRDQIDRVNPRITTISLSNQETITILKIDDKEFNFSNYDSLNGDFSKKGCRVIHEKQSKLIPNEQHWKSALDTLMGVLRNPNLRLEWLEIKRFERTHVNKFLEMLKGLELHVEYLSIQHSVPLSLLPILKFLKPVILKEIELNMYVVQNDLPRFQKMITEINNLEQVKQLDMMTIGKAISWNAVNFKSFRDCTRVTLNVGLGMKQPLAKTIRTLLQSRTLEIFQFNMETSMDTESVVQSLCDKWNCAPMDNGRIRFRTPETGLSFEIEVSEWSVRIERV
ncbi:unnamed protein product [Caenorhabditis brenneri]